MIKTNSETIKYLDLSTNKLLEEFGKGSHVPGSGSAAVLSGLFALELMKTVCILTLRKEKYVAVHKDFQFIKDQLENDFKSHLTDLFYADIHIFKQVSVLRKERDAETDLKKQKNLSEQESDKLKKATEIPIEVCEICLRLIKYAFSIFDKGFKSARGDSGVAISNLLSAISGSIFVIYLNINTRKKSKWANDMRHEAQNLTNEYLQMHRDSFLRVNTLYSESLAERQLPVPFGTNTNTTTLQILVSDSTAHQYSLLSDEQKQAISALITDSISDMLDLLDYISFKAAKRGLAHDKLNELLVS